MKHTSRAAQLISTSTSTSVAGDHYKNTINKTRVKIDGSVSIQIQRAMHTMARFADAGLGGIWGNMDAEWSQDGLVKQAEIYLRQICKLHDTSSNEVEAMIAVGAAVQTRKQDIAEYIKRQTGWVQGAGGLRAAIDRLQGECTFGLTAERCNDAFRSDADYPRLLRLAEVGVERTLPDGFEPQGPPNTLSTYQLRCKNVFITQALKWAEQGQVLLVSTPALKTEKKSTLL